MFWTKLKLPIAIAASVKFRLDSPIFLSAIRSNSNHVCAKSMFWDTVKGIVLKAFEVKDNADDVYTGNILLVVTKAAKTKLFDAAWFSTMPCDVETNVIGSVINCTFIAWPACANSMFWDTVKDIVLKAFEVKDNVDDVYTGNTLTAVNKVDKTKLFDTVKGIVLKAFEVKDSTDDAYTGNTLLVVTKADKTKLFDRSKDHTSELHSH